MMMNNISIYIHIPFCDSKCYYCNFVSGKYNNEIKEKYFQKLIEEIKLKKDLFKNKIINSIFIGGGTPSSIDEKYIINIFNELNNDYNISKNAEISIEANPCSASESKLKTYLSLGINRISFGVQSLNNKCLKNINRKHNKIQAINAIKLAKKIGFRNINCDILIGIPNQNYFILKSTVKKLIKLKITHLSCYMLIKEKDTPLYQMIEDKKVKVASDDVCVTWYEKLVKFLKKKNFNRYEISNFAISNFQCKHNVNYWDMGEYVGFGVAAHSFYNGKRFCHSNSISSYIGGENLIEEELSKEDVLTETIMLGLRQTKGIEIARINELGYDILQVKKNAISNLQKLNILKVENGRIIIEDNYFGVCNQIILKLLP